MKIKSYGTGAKYGLPEIFYDCRICRHAREVGDIRLCRLGIAKFALDEIKYR